MKFFSPKTLELTLALIKPHAAVVPPIVNDIKQKVLANGFFVVDHKRCILSLENANKMYEEHKGKPFYARLVSMMTSGPIDSFILTRENAIKHWRQMMGPTRSYEAQFEYPDTTRGLYGLSNTRNATHGSDSKESFQKEANIFFPTFISDDWYAAEEQFFRNGFVKFNENDFLHFSEKKESPLL